MPDRERKAVELQALRKRFPKPTPSAALFQCAMIVLVNAYLVYLVATDQTSPLGIAAFNLCEFFMLSIVSNIAVAFVPREQRLGGNDTLDNATQKLFVFVLGIVFLAGMYWVSVGWDKTHIARALHAASVLDAALDMHIVWPLAITTIATAAATIGDLATWRRKGGLFVPQYAVGAAPKILTVLLAPMPALVVSDNYVKTDFAAAAIAWSVTYLAIRSAIELGLLAFQYAGMPERNAGSPIS